ncbi:MAG: response regulator [Actinobacteria bacterium]|nr:response regulator [Actinomycetota bacterium]
MWQAGKRPRVLVADGDEDALTQTALRLGRAGYEVLVARDGEEALARAAAEAPDLCLIDAMTPKLTGYDVTRRLRSDPRTSDVPVLLMTAQAQHRQPDGPDRVAYLPKPCSPRALRAGVSAALAQNAPRRISTAGTVFSRITRSSATDQRSR